MKTIDLEYNLPQELIAVEPKRPRDAARLLVARKNDEPLIDSDFRHLADFLKKGDLLVFNETKVFPARIFAKKETGGALELVFLEEVAPFTWEVIVGGKLKEGQKIILSDKIYGTIVKKTEGLSLIRVSVSREQLLKFLSLRGQVPLPPYIKRAETKKDKIDYQTIFARNLGSAAAPTASLHFSKRLMDDLEKRGIEKTFITLHVGLGTFAPVKSQKLEDHPIHSEYFEISPEAAFLINQAKKEERRVIAVGTTVVRALESAENKGQVKAQKGHTKLFIYPGYEFRIIDGLITNFHTPRSSLLGLVYAFLGEEKTKKAYSHAIKKQYRFFSYGDGMLII